MFQKTHTTGRALRRGLGLALVFATLSLSADGVLAARGGKPQPTGTPATLTFDDLLGDAIRSDGLGSYDATIENGVITLSTGKKRKLFYDFSTCLGIDLRFCDGPFGSTTGTAATSMWVDLATGTAGFKFNGSGGEQLLSVGGLSIGQFDDNDDGTIDRYVIETTGVAGHGLYRLIKRGGRYRGFPRYEFRGTFSMPWGFEVVVD